MRGTAHPWCLILVVVTALVELVVPNDIAKGIENAKRESVGKIERSATREGNVIYLHPGDVTFEVPEGWRGPNIGFRLTRQDLHNKAAGALWGAQIADGALKMEDCAAQIELHNLNWMRAYLVDLSEEEMLKRIRERGWKAASKIPNYVRGHSSGFQTVPAKEDPWTHVDIPYVLDFGDYSGGGDVSFYLRAAGTRELVVVFGHFAAGAITPPDERQTVLKSVVVHDPAAKTQ